MHNTSPNCKNLNLTQKILIDARRRTNTKSQDCMAAGSHWNDDRTLDISNHTLYVGEVVLSIQHERRLA